MKTILARIARKTLATKFIDPADVARIVAYNNRHPMWRIGADDLTVAAYDAIMKQVGRAA